MTPLPPLPTRPGMNAGEVGPRTLERRGPLPLTEAERAYARFLRFDVNMDWPDVATAVHRTEADVRHSLASARTRRTSPRRGTVNVGLAAIDRLRKLQSPGEPMWQVMNRVLGIT